MLGKEGRLCGTGAVRHVHDESWYIYEVRGYDQLLWRVLGSQAVAERL